MTLFNAGADQCYLHTLVVSTVKNCGKNFRKSMLLQSFSERGMNESAVPD